MHRKLKMTAIDWTFAVMVIGLVVLALHRREWESFVLLIIYGLMGTVLYVALNSALHRRLAKHIARIIAAVIFIYLLTSPYIPKEYNIITEMTESIAVLVFLIPVQVTLIHYFFKENRIRGVTILAAIIGYITLGLLWAAAYEIVYFIDITSFEGVKGQTIAGFGRSGLPSIYFSMATLTTLGYGDITPMTMPTRLLAILEAASGQIYVAVLIARLVALQVSQRIGDSQTR